MTRTNKSIFIGIHAAVVRGLVASVLLLAFAANARAQCLEGWLPGAGSPGTNGTVRATAVLSSGDIVVGGEFTWRSEPPKLGSRSSGKLREGRSNGSRVPANGGECAGSI